MQHEILKSSSLLDSNGNISEPGFAKSLLPIYRRKDIKASKLRIKEWDYYLINNGHYAVALTIDDNGYMSMDSISLLDLDEGWEITTSPMGFMPLGKINLPESSIRGDSIHKAKGRSMQFLNDGSGIRYLKCHMDNFGLKGCIDIDIKLTDAPKESIVICTPFNKTGHFYFNQKLNCMRAEGIVKYGDMTYIFSPNESFAVLDWGRGVWTYHNTWYWGSASYHINGIPFGWNIGYGFGDTSAASENMLFYDGKANKIGNIKFNIPDNEKSFLKEWTISSDDNRFEMIFTPVLDRSSCTDVKLIKSDQHQVFGFFSGTAVLDDGTILNIKDFPGFAEKVENKW